MTILVLSCDKFSDLWSGHIKLLEQNWPDRDMDTFIVTDAPTEKSYPTVKVISAGIVVEWSDRLKYALKMVKTDYVFITLDDYFLIKKVSDNNIADLLSIMMREKIDYIRLFPKPERATKEELHGYPGVYKIDKKIPYCVNLYSGMWNSAFLYSIIKEPMNAWRFEVSLAKRARDYNASCVVSVRNEFEILDVVRKGKLLHNAVKYFYNHPGIYDGNRLVNTWIYEIQLCVQIFMADHLPLWVHKPVKSIMNLFGKRFYSDEVK